MDYYDLVLKQNDLDGDTLLDCSYWDGHSSLPLEDWKYEVANGDTRVGYWEFVARQLGYVE